MIWNRKLQAVNCEALLPCYDFWATPTWGVQIHLLLGSDSAGQRSWTHASPPMLTSETFRRKTGVLLVSKASVSKRERKASALLHDIRVPSSRTRSLTWSLLLSRHHPNLLACLHSRTSSHCYTHVGAMVDSKYNLTLSNYTQRTGDILARGMLPG